MLTLVHLYAGREGLYIYCRQGRYPESLAAGAIDHELTTITWVYLYSYLHACHDLITTSIGR